jgi:LysM repeat protein
LLLLSDWYGDPSLTPAETKEINELLSQLAGSVIYSTEHRLEPPYLVQAGEQLPDIAQKYHVPWQLLAKINGLEDRDQLQAGQQLKVVRGPFSALIDLSERRMTLMLDRRYAGQLPLDVDPATSVEEGDWTVNQKLLTPGNVDPMSASPTAGDQKSIMMSSAAGGTSQIVILRGGNSSTPAATDPAGRVIRLKSQDVDDVYDILSLGSHVTIRR